MNEIIIYHKMASRVEKQVITGKKCLHQRIHVKYSQPILCGTGKVL